MLTCLSTTKPKMPSALQKQGGLGVILLDQRDQRDERDPRKLSDKPAGNHHSSFIVVLPVVASPKFGQFEYSSRHLGNLDEERRR
jgi:hypothetical protein